MTMSNSLQEFLATAAEKASADLVAAFLRLPEDKRTWKPSDTARSALDQMAECALLNGASADLMGTRRWNHSYPYPRLHTEAQAQGWEYVRTVLAGSTRRVATAIRAVPDDALDAKVTMPGETPPLAQVLAFAYWNMSYHEGQINYIASILGCLP